MKKRFRETRGSFGFKDGRESPPALDIEKYDLARKLPDGRIEPLDQDSTLNLAEMQKNGGTNFVTVPKGLLDIGRHMDAFSMPKIGGMDAVVERLRRTLAPSEEVKFADQVEHLTGLVEGLPADRRRPTIQRAFEKVERLSRRKKREQLQRAQIVVAEDNEQYRQRRREALAHVSQMGADLKLQRLGETGFHKCRQAIFDGSILVGFRSDVRVEAGPSVTLHDLQDAHTFVVQHDWAAAFEKAKDFDGGEYRLPYDLSVYEFRISGSRVCFSVDADENNHPNTGGLYVETPAGWMLGTPTTFRNGAWACAPVYAPLVKLCGDQVRAIAVALEAEVAITDVVRAPHKLNRKRIAAGKLPVLDYHIVSLANRKRYTPRLPEPGDIETEHARRRLHFVRGHYRHYANHKVYVSWHFRGDPDLGFIDKEYRL